MAVVLAGIAGCGSPPLDLGRASRSPLAPDRGWAGGTGRSGSPEAAQPPSGTVPVARALGRPAAEEKALYHEVRSGESLADIAAAYGTSVARLVSANGFDAADALTPGQLVYIPPRR